MSLPTHAHLLDLANHYLWLAVNGPSNLHGEQHAVIALTYTNLAREVHMRELQRKLDVVAHDTELVAGVAPELTP